jgi:hypothetical protein
VVHSNPLPLDGRSVAAIVYDATLLPDPEPVRAAGRVAAIALDRERLTAQLLASEEELRDARRWAAAYRDHRRQCGRRKTIRGHGTPWHGRPGTRLWRHPRHRQPGGRRYPGGGGDGMRILIGEDETLRREGLSLVFSQQGMEVTGPQP